MTSAEKKSLLNKGNSFVEEENFSSSSWSSSSSYSTSQESLSYEWNSFVSDDKKLFYIDFNPYTQNNQKSNQNLNSLSAAKHEFSRASTRRSSKTVSKLSKLITRKPRSKHDRNITTGSEISKVTFSETSKGEVKEVFLSIDPAMRFKFGRRSIICESILGLSVCPFPDDDSKRMMVANFVPNSILANDKTVKVGDWLKSINDIEINSENLDNILLSYTEPTEVLLKLQRISDEESIQPSQNSLTKITNLSMLNDNIDAIFGSSSETDLDKMVFSMMYLTMEGLNEQGPEGQDVLFCYPPKAENCLYLSRGTFLTINSVLTSMLSCVPSITTVDFHGQTYYISYTVFNEDLLLIAISSKYVTITETKLKTIEIIRYLEFTNRILPGSFIQQNSNELNIMCNLITHFYRNKKIIPFERILLEPHYVPLPKEAQLRIDDALGEMEAMDYRDWNDEPLKSHREFFIVGSALYYKSYLLSSHLPSADIIDIECFLRIQGIKKLLELQSVKNLIIWREIYPKSCDRGLISEEENKIYGTPNGHWYLALIARNHMLLCLILEHRDQTIQKENDNINNNIKIGPSPFYIEEIQETLEHLKTGGIEMLASTWIQHNKRPECIIETNNDLVTTQSTSATSQSISKKTELISILKRRNNSADNLRESMNRHSHSHTGSSLSEESNNIKYDDDEEESDEDWDGFPDSQKGSSGFDMSEMTETLLKEVSDIIPTKITAGLDNVLYFYVQIEVGEAYLLAPTNSIDNIIIDTFKKTCLLIHTILQNTIKFRQLLSDEGNKTNNHRSLVAIKEHGILINVTDTKGEEIEFWVIGRLFNSPARELYVCHRSDVPQNMVEIAFRLSLHTSG